MSFTIVSVNFLRESVSADKNVYIKSDSITDDIRVIRGKRIRKSIHIGKRKGQYHCIEKSTREMINAFNISIYFNQFCIQCVLILSNRLSIM